MIYEGSRYERAAVLQIRTAEGLTFPAVYQRPSFDAQHIVFDPYVVQQGDRLDVLAYSYYGDALLWWIIARANPEVFYPDTPAPGTVIRIPHANSIR